MKRVLNCNRCDDEVPIETLVRGLCIECREPRPAPDFIFPEDKELQELIAKRKQLLQEFAETETKIKQILLKKEGMLSVTTVIHHCNCGFSSEDWFVLTNHISDYPASSDHFILNKGERKKEIQIERELKGKTGFEIL